MGKNSRKDKGSVYGFIADTGRRKIAVLIQTKKEATSLGLERTAKLALKSSSFEKIEFAECSLDQCRRLLECDCRGLYEKDCKDYL